MHRALCESLIDDPHQHRSCGIREGEHRVRTSIEWDGPLLALEHQVVSGGTVRETLEVVGDRMIMRRTVSGTGAGEPLVLAYDRN